jgi:hypothetical protein
MKVAAAYEEVIAEYHSERLAKIGAEHAHR